MFQILLSNLSIILLAYLCLSSMDTSRIPKPIVNGMNVVGYSAVIIFLFYNPVKIEDFLFDLRIVVFLFLAITHGWRMTIPVLVIAAIWRLSVIGGPVAIQSVVMNMTAPALMGLIFYRGKNHLFLLKKILMIATVIWLVTQMSLIWLVPNGWDIFKRIAVVHYLAFIISVIVLYSLYINRIKNKEMKEKIQFMAFHDALTGIPNRYKLSEYLQNAIVRCKQNHEQLAVLFLDLDRFKFINDTKGHATGDLLLKQVADRLASVIRKRDIVARQGGDEFVLLLQDIQPDEVRHVAERITESLQKPFMIHDEELFTTPSIGISLYPQDGEDEETLINNADKAMYAVKKRGKNHFQFYSHDHGDSLKKRAKIEQCLRRAIENEEFALHYQPEVCLRTGKLYATEALVRWNHPQMGSVPPSDFIPVAEEMGMIVPLGKWILREACRQAKQWHLMGMNIKMAVNVSAIQFEESGFVDEIIEVLQENQLAPEYLILEITESVMQNIEKSTEMIEDLKKIGVAVAIDDFGTGYSSLSVLNNLPIDLVKIDKSFVSESLIKPNTAALIKTIIKMGEDFNFKLVAEGIETKEQAEFISEGGCHFGQGYYYGKPLSAEEIGVEFRTSFGTSFGASLGTWYAPKFVE